MLDRPWLRQLRKAPAMPTARFRPGPLTFDPVAIGGLECDAWAAYYRRDWRRFLTAAVRMVHAGFGMGRRRTVIGAWHVLRANQVWAPYPNNDPDAARAHMRHFYALVAASGHPRLDPDRAAGLEVEWWRVHRLHQRTGTASDGDLVAALVALYAFVYGRPPASLESAARLRTAAMDVSDRWVAAGRNLADPLLAEERRLLIASYSALRDAIDSNAVDPADGQASTGRPPLDIAASGGSTPVTGTGSGVA
jgi:hypothetical protein